MTLLRLLFLVLGWAALGLGTLGAFLPLLPTVPLYLLAALLFAKSSPRLHRWFTGTALYKKHLESYVNGQGLTLATKGRIAAAITVSMGLGLWLLRAMPLAQLVLAALWLGLMVYFFAIVKTCSEE